MELVSSKYADVQLKIVIKNQVLKNHVYVLTFLVEYLSSW